KENAAEYADALPDYEEAFKLRPDSNEARLRLANVLYRVGRVREAVGHFEWLRQQESNKQVLLGLAKCRYDLHQLDEARQLLEALLAENPSYVPALVERGRVAFRQGQVPKAENLLQRAVKIAPFDRESHVILHRFLDVQGKKAEAQKCLARINEIDVETLKSLDLMMQVMDTPDDPNPRYEMGKLLMRTGREEQGVHWLVAALLQDPRHFPSHAALADYYERTGQQDLAEQHRLLAYGR
ncbi:MAG TPA: tetratricopeptide repeat protein, partial [Gemmataceae bacterium]|nr:tetratricopeptide repeat protein [Gemmataceae bacterium]